MSLMTEMLRSLDSLAGPFPAFDPAAAPEDPRDLFVAWFQGAVDAGVHEPHAMTLSTVDDAGYPDARILILKGMDEDGWHFAATRTSRKGVHIDKNPKAALTFYWQPLGRQVRLRGAVQDMGPAARDADFRAKPAGSRAAALLARQSQVLCGTSTNSIVRSRGNERASPKIPGSSRRIGRSMRSSRRRSSSGKATSNGGTFGCAIAGTRPVGGASVSGPDGLTLLPCRWLRIPPSPRAPKPRLQVRRHRRRHAGRSPSAPCASARCSIPCECGTSAPRYVPVR